MPELRIFNVKIHIEVPVILLFYAFLLSDSIKTNLIIDRTCYVTLGYNKSECALLGTKHPDNETANLEKLVQPHATIIKMIHTLFDAFFSAFACFFVGPWTDHFGRKPILIATAIGYIFHYIFNAIFAVWQSLSPWYQILCSIPIYLTGGGSCLVTAVTCYIADVTIETNRGARMGSFEAALSLGIFLGNLSSAYIFRATNYATVFLLSACCCLAALVFTYFFIPESLETVETEGRLRSLFKVRNVKDMFKATFRKRENYDRFTVVSCLIMLILYLIVVQGDGAIVFYYLRRTFHWSVEQYTLYSAMHNITGIIGILVGVYLLHKLLKIPETIMILVGFLSMFNGMLTLGLAVRDRDVYFGACLRALSGGLSPMVRSLVSKVVPNEETGKIFATIVISEALFGMLGSPIYTAIYNATIDKNPSVYNFVSAALYFVEILISLSIIVVRTFKNDVKIHIGEIADDDSPLLVDA